MTNRSLVLACLSSSLLSLSACGGGGTTTPAPISPPPPTNQAPVAAANAESAAVTEGRGIILSASGSSDADGDDLTFSWEQISGPTAPVSSGSSGVEFTAEAPDVNADTILTFEVTVSDGTTSATDKTSITVEPLGFKFIDRFSIDIVPSSASSYKIFSGGTGIGQFNYTAQEFSSEGDLIGDPISGSLTPENNTQGYVLSFKDVIQSGDIVYNSFSFTLDTDTGGFSGPEEIGLSTLRGPIDQDFQTIGDIYASFSSESNFLGYDAISIGTEELATITIVPLSAGRRDVVAHIINPDGTVAASAKMADQALFPNSPQIARFDESTVAGFWLRNGQLNMQVMDIDENLIGTNATFDPINGNFFTRISALSLSNGTIATITDEGPNNDPVIALRVFNSLGELSFAPTEIGKGTDPTALGLNDGNILVVWRNLNSQFLGRIVSPSGALITETYLFESEIILNPPSPVQLEDGTVIIGSELSLLSFPIEDIGLFPPATQ